MSSINKDEHSSNASSDSTASSISEKKTGDEEIHDMNSNEIVDGSGNPNTSTKSSANTRKNGSGSVSGVSKRQTASNDIDSENLIKNDKEKKDSSNRNGSNLGVNANNSTSKSNGVSSNGSSTNKKLTKKTSSSPKNEVSIKSIGNESNSRSGSIGLINNADDSTGRISPSLANKKLPSLSSSSSITKKEKKYK